MIPAPVAVRLEVPVTVSAPVCVIGLALLLATRFPVTVPEPRSNAPVEFAVSAPVASVPSVSAFWSVICVVPPVSVTAPMKLLPAFVHVMAPVPALTEVVPVTIFAAVCVTAPLAITVIDVTEASRLIAFASVICNAPPAATDTRPWKSLVACVSVMLPAPALMLVTLPTVNGPLCVTAPPLLIAPIFPSTVPVPRLSAPVEVASTFVTARVPSVNAFASTMPVLAPVRLTAPWKSLPKLFNAMSLARPALMFDVPVTVRLPVCVTAPAALVEATRLPATVPAPRFNAPVEVAVRSPPRVSVPSVSALASVIEALFAPVLLSVTAPVKLFVPVVSVIAFAPAVTKVVPPIVRLPFCVTAPPAVTPSVPVPVLIAPSVTVPVGAFAVTLPLKVVMLPVPAPKEIFPSGELRTTLSELAVFVAVMASLMKMLPAPPPAPAFSVRVRAPPKAPWVIGALTVMFPAVPLVTAAAFAVVMTTDVPPSSTELMSVFRILDVATSFIGVKRPPTEPVLLVVAPVVMVTSVSGSNSQRPPLPFGAPAPPRTPVASRMWWPEVSIRPPFPPRAPPRAQMVPCALVKPSDQTMTLPPSPRVMASALMVASLSM